MDDQPQGAAAAAAAYRHKCAQALEHLQGIVDGMVSDGRLDPREVQFLNRWLDAHPEATADWPGSLLQRRVRLILADGVISADEQRRLLESLKHLASTLFDDGETRAMRTGSPLPVEDGAAVDVRGSRVCLAGHFLFGDRPACERLLRDAGAELCARVSTKVNFLVIGARTSTAWPSQPGADDIHEAIALRRLGHPIAIVSERRLLDSLG